MSAPTFAPETIARLRLNRSRAYDTCEPGADEGRRRKIAEYDALVEAAKGPSTDDLRAIAREAVKARDRDLYNFACRVFAASGFKA